MMKTSFLLAVAGTALITACSEPSGGENNLAGGNALAIDGNVLANVAGDISLNGTAEAPAANEAAAGSGAVQQPRPAAPVRTPPAPAARPEPAPKAQADRPPTERSAPRPAPKQQPSPPPASTCTPEHEAMGHCKQ